MKLFLVNWAWVLGLTLVVVFVVVGYCEFMAWLTEPLPVAWQVMAIMSLPVLLLTGGFAHVVTLAQRCWRAAEEEDHTEAAENAEEE